jgi:hypothetical protein
VRIDEYIGYNDSVQCWVNTPAPINEDETWRVLGSNTNGMNVYGDFKQFISIMEKLRDLKAWCILLNKTNVEWHKWAYRENTQQLLSKTFDGARIEYSTSKVKFNSAYKPSDTLSNVVGSWSYRVVRSGHDEMDCGRWSYLTHAFKENAFLNMISSYIVVCNLKTGIKMAYMQQYIVQHDDEEL